MISAFFKKSISLYFTIIGLGLVIALAAYAGDPSKVTRKVLLKQDMAIPEKEVVMIAVEIQPGGEEGRHTHPAELYAVVQEGALLLESEGKENTTYKAGEAFSVGSGKIHNGKNNGTVAVKLNAFLVAEKGKPLSSPAK